MQYDSIKIRFTVQERLIYMRNLRDKITSFVMAACIVFSSAFLLLPSEAQAADTVTSTVNIATADKNMRGPGYDWANRYDILTLTNLHLDTEEAYGLRLPKNCTVILEGNNYIKADKYGISCSGNIVFKGKGSLTIDAGEIGIYLITQDSSQKIRLIEGKYTINAGKYGVYSDAADFSFVNGNLDINMSGEDSYAIFGRCVNLLGGKFSANASVETTHELVVDNIDIDIVSTASALASKNLKIKNISVEDYNGEHFPVHVPALFSVTMSRDGSIIFFLQYLLQVLPPVSSSLHSAERKKLKNYTNALKLKATM